MLDVILWWLAIELIGLAVLPVAFNFFRNLPDRGYAFVKPLGLLLVAYPFWLLTTLGFLTNVRGAIALVAVIVAGLSWWLAGRESSGEGTDRLSLVAWLRQNVPVVLTTELVFTGAFVLWTLVRAYMPEITATEKPMDFAFLNGILQSEHFPPLDPWLSGYGISYYYFGYLIIALLTMLSGVAPGVAFNLAITSLFALAATGAFGLTYNLIAGFKGAQVEASRSDAVQADLSGALRSPVSKMQALFYSLFAPIFLLLCGNLEGLLEALHARGIGSPEFWGWIDVKGLVEIPSTGTFVPTDNWWWWRASRVIHDIAFGQTQEVIDEFPQFSFLLGDMHPHVMALPFVLLALGAALNLLSSSLADRDSLHEFRIGDVRFGILPFDFGLLPLMLGALFLLNSWDILPYGFIFVAAFVLARFRVGGSWDSRATADTAAFVVSLGALGVLMYLPFFLGFQSQAGGILPTLYVKTRLHQYLIMFGLFIFILAAMLVHLGVKRSGLSAVELLRRAAPYLVAAAIFPMLVAVLAMGILALTPALLDQARAAVPGTSNLLALAFSAYLAPWLGDPWLSILLALFLAVILVLIRILNWELSATFALLLAFTGLLLTFGVEFAYLRDQFGTRMNTVFKFYFQTWTLLSIASAYAVFYLSRALTGVARAAWFASLALLLAASLVYPALAIPNRADGFHRTPTLDGIAWIREFNPGDYAAIQWLYQNAPRGSKIVEAPGGEYSYGNRISMATGLPTVLGWAGHESQWRGSSKLFKDDETGIDRAMDVQRIYQTFDPKELLTLLDKYDIQFVIVGQSEKSQYSLTKTQIDKFGKVMALVFEYGDVRIYTRAS